MAPAKEANMAINTPEAPEQIAAPTAAPGFKICAGSIKHGLPSHEAPLDAFGKNVTYEDGLSRLCKACASAYTKALRAIKRDAPEAPAAETVTDAPVE
jgi:hypothetical protein